MKRALLALALPLAMFTTTGCAGYIMIDGYEATYATAPVHIETRTRYAYRGGYVYHHDGRYYRQHSGRWVVYRTRPADLHITVR